MSQWNYTKCSKPFSTQEDAREYMVTRGFGGHILKRGDGGFTAVCPTYPDGYYSDAVVVESIEEGQATPSVTRTRPVLLPVVDSQSGCCA